MAEQALFNFVAVSAAEAVNRIEDPQAKALSLQTMRVAVERDPSSVEFIMQEVLKHTASKIEEFRTLLQQTSMTAIDNQICEDKGIVATSGRGCEKQEGANKGK